ncbi:thiamine-monophosphate kinase [Tepidicaulis marinus]|uniref:Thiamine-monophosphate kinase n=1 Tax=Tepidicaulis marinus TaxID=1333998 RepID=A0A081B7U1_9HYPH|nr:thiamine-phosphate kinase [Tepidicaulis marinus]GAK44109.1 thiamine-monophosphate kinase [Tepidicaulis marinus]
MAGQGNTGEFEIIERYFAPLAKRTEGAFGLKDDAALFQPRPGYDLVMTKDAIVAGVHFLPADPYDLVAQKLVRVNVSDLAAKGAEPKAYLLALAWPEGVEEKDIALFAAGLQKDQDIYGLELLGGDTVKTPGPATFSLTAIGTVPHGEFIRRSGAKAGDAVYVTGTLGDAALGLKLARGDIDLLSISERRALIQRYRLPQPRVAVGAGLRGIASAGLDISDGLGADLLHLCKASGLRARISQSALPLSAPARQLLKKDETLWPSVLNGGDDYEIVFAAPGEAGVKLELLAGSTGVPITRIGYLEAGEPAVLLEDMSGRTEPLAESGYRHF